MAQLEGGAQPEAPLEGTPPEVGSDSSRPLQRLVESSPLHFEEAPSPHSIPAQLGLACEDPKTSSRDSGDETPD